MRDLSTDNMAEILNSLWGSFPGSKEEFMMGLPGVTSDVRVEKAPNCPWGIAQDETVHYCTVVALDLEWHWRIYEIWSYDDGPWKCKS